MKKINENTLFNHYVWIKGAFILDSSNQSYRPAEMSFVINMNTLIISIFKMNMINCLVNAKHLLISASVMLFAILASFSMFR